MRYLLLVQFSFILLAHVNAQMNLPSTYFDNFSDEKARDEFLVNTRLFQFDSDYLEPWIEGITHLRAYGVDFKKPKDSDGLYQYTDPKKVEDFIAFCKEKNLKVIWTLNVSSYTLAQEMEFVESLIDRGLNITGFEYGGEFYLKKYYFGNKSAKGVVEKIRMDGENRDYLDLLELWLPAISARYPFDEYKHILITASHGKTQSRQDRYRREFNQKIYDWVKDHPEYSGKVDFSYHIYAGAKPDRYSADEANVLRAVNWDFLDLIPKGSQWICTESGYYIKNYSEEELEKARHFLTEQSQELGKDGLMGIHTLFIPVNRRDPLALYTLSGLTPVGENLRNWLQNTPPPDQPDNHEDSPTQGSPSGNNSSNIAEEPTLVKIFPEYGGFWDFIHFNQTLKFSNGKSYKRSYWFSKPTFTQDDIGKPIGYFKKKIKN